MDSTPDASRWRIAVVGVGAVGGFYGAKLARRGLDVRFLMRSDLAHVREHGLRVHAATGENIVLPEVRCFGDPREIGPCDAVLIAMKATANPALESVIPPLLKEDTVLVTLQNGLGNEEFLAKRFGPGRVLGGLCFVCLNRTAPGIIEHYEYGKIMLGEFGRPPAPRTRALAAEFAKAGVECEIADDLTRARWQKLVWNIPFNGLSILGGGIDVGRILADESLTALTRSLMREIILTAGKLGHPLPGSLPGRQIASTRTMGNYRPSSMIDFLEGRDVEVEAIWGEPFRQAQAAGIEAGRLETVYHLIKSAVDRRTERVPD